MVSVRGTQGTVHNTGADQPLVSSVAGTILPLSSLTLQRDLDSHLLRQGEGWCGLPQSETLDLFGSRRNSFPSH